MEKHLLLPASNTDIQVIREGRYCPASMAYCLGNDYAELRLIPRNRPRLYNIDFDTRGEF